MTNRVFDDICKFRYDEFRKGETKKSSVAHTVYNRCILTKAKNKRCIFTDMGHKNCPVSTAKKHKVKSGLIRFKGKWRKR